MLRVATIVVFQILLSATVHGQVTQEESRAVVLVIDTSGSMREQNRLHYVKEWSKSIARQLIEADYFGVVGFDGKPSVVLSLEQVGVLRQKDLIDKQIDPLRPAGQTYFLPALLEARRQLESSGAAKKHIILLSDGITRGSQVELIDLAIGVKKGQAISVSTIAISSDADARLMRRIAVYGGGSFQLVCNPSNLPQITLASVLSHGVSEDAQKCP